MSRNVKIVVGVLVGAFVLGGVALAIGGDDLMGRLRFRSVRQSVQESVKVKTPKVVSNSCPTSTAGEVVLSTRTGTIGFPEFTDVEGWHNALYAETGGVSNGEVNCPYTIEVFSEDSSVRGTRHEFYCDTDDFNLTDDGKGFYTVSCSDKSGNRFASVNLSSSSVGAGYAVVYYADGVGKHSVRTSYWGNRTFVVRKRPSNY